MSNIIYKSFTVKEATDILCKNAEENKKLLIITHKNPDGDAVGSSFALKKIYKCLGADAECICTDQIPTYLNFLTNIEKMSDQSENNRYDLLITVDTASPMQMGRLSMLSEKVDLSIDHHEFYTPYSNELRDIKAGAAGEIIFEIYDELKKRKKIEENCDICRLLYAAISADTGSFKYSNTTEKTHIIASKLVNIINNDNKGPDTAEISRLLHNCKSKRAILAEKVAIDNLKYTEDGKIAYILLNRKTITENNLTDEDFGAAIDIPRSIEGVECSFIIKEFISYDVNRKNQYKISTRSNNDINVAEICKIFDGGGHAKAAGATIEAENIEAAEEILLKEFKKAIYGEK